MTLIALDHSEKPISLDTCHLFFSVQPPSPVKCCWMQGAVYASANSKDLGISKLSVDYFLCVTFESQMIFSEENTVVVEIGFV